MIPFENYVLDSPTNTEPRNVFYKYALILPLESDEGTHRLLWSKRRHTIFVNTHERITDKISASDHRRKIKDTKLKNTVLVKTTIKIKTKQLNWEFRDKQHSENTKIREREYRTPNRTQILRDRVLATWRFRGKAKRSKSAKLSFVCKINISIIFPWSISIALHFDMSIQHLPCFPRPFQLDVDDALRKWIYKELTTASEKRVTTSQVKVFALLSKPCCCSFSRVVFLLAYAWQWRGR